MTMMMKKMLLLFLFIFVMNTTFSQTKAVSYDENLAKSLQADQYGMKNYIFCLLKTGSNTKLSKEELDKVFQGHMKNISRLAEEGKLVMGGPFGENDRNYRGIFVFNVTTLAEAEQLVKTDPAVQADVLAYELTPLYSSAALQEINKIHSRITKTKFE